MAPLEDGSLPDKKTAYMLFLRAAEARGMDLPGAAFAVAKMLDGMLVQQVQLLLFARHRSTSLTFCGFHTSRWSTICHLWLICAWRTFYGEI